MAWGATKEKGGNGGVADDDDHAIAADKSNNEKYSSSSSPGGGSGATTGAPAVNNNVYTATGGAGNHGGGNGASPAKGGSGADGGAGAAAADVQSLARGKSGAGSSSSSSSSSTGAAAAAPMVWKFQQSFGETVPGEEVLDADIISRLEFDQTGEYLASGDRGGRVVLFKRCHAEDANGVSSSSSSSMSSRSQPWFKYLTEFQSHEPEFDYLKSHEILEKINQVRWCHGAAGSQTLLTTNDKKVKMWKVSEQSVQFCTNFNLRDNMETSMSPPSSPSPSLGSPCMSPRPSAVYGLSGSIANVFCGDRAMVYSERALSNPLSSSSMQNGAASPPPRGGSSSRTLTELRVPTTRTKEKVWSARCRRVYCNAHAYHINSIALSSDGETFISADDLTINLWHVDVPTHGHTIVNMKPASFEDLTELITCADFHPRDCSTFCYGCSKGSIRLADLRATAVCGGVTKVFEETVGNRSFFSEITASVSDCKFSRCGRFLIARDYMTVKVWDVKMERAPIATMKVHEHLRSKLGDMYESNCIFDKFDCCVSPNGDHVATGSYSNIMRVFGVNNGTEHTLECSMNPQKFNTKAAPREGSRLGLGRLRRDSRRSSLAQGFTGELDTATKILNMAWHPTEDILAVASTNSLFYFNACP